MLIQPTNSSSCTSRIAHRRSVSILAFALVMLGFCVFAWGLNYKLSLYAPPHSIARRMPEAKLVAGKERSPAPAVDLRQSSPSNLPLAPTGLALLLLCLRVPRLNPGFAGYSDFVPLRHPAARALTRAHAVRPPPFAC